MSYYFPLICTDQSEQSKSMLNILEIKNKIKLGDYTTIYTSIKKDGKTASYDYIRMVIQGKRKSNSSLAQLILCKADKLIKQRENL